jgi:hypothetical protein
MSIVHAWTAAFSLAYDVLCTGFWHWQTLEGTGANAMQSLLLQFNNITVYSLCNATPIKRA